jgi:Flp pilus assembly protein TadB
VSELAILAVGELVLIAVLVAALLWREHKHDGEIRWMVESEARERDVLIQRVQAPERQPVLPRHLETEPSPEMIERLEEAQQRDEQHRKALAAVGTVPPPPPSE